MQLECRSFENAKTKQFGRLNVNASREKIVGEVTVAESVFKTIQNRTSSAELEFGF